MVANTPSRSGEQATAERQPDPKLSHEGNLVTVPDGRGVGFSEDGTPATEALLGFACGLALDAAGDLYFTDSREHTVAKVDAAGTLTTVAGCERYAGDGARAQNAVLNLPASLVIDTAGSFPLPFFRRR
jgi:hypothetical protein